MSDQTTTLAVYTAIARVSAALAKHGISKHRKNQQQGYSFRGIDDMYNALAPLLASEGLVVLPRCLSRDVTERTTAKGSALFYVVVDVEFDFVSAVDGSRHTVRLPGEAMDSADKATNKAMSAAYKYAVMQVFCIPTEGDNDADAQTHDVAAKAPAGYDSWKHDMSLVAEEGLPAYQAAWKDSRREFTIHALSQDVAWHEANKQRAQQAQQEVA
jgi:hypothetical protein